MGVLSDMDNSHMLSISEQKMSTDDWKVCSRDLERDRKKATLQVLMDWMTIEMKSQMRATAPLRTGSSTQRSVNHFLGDASNKGNATWHKCWMCKNSEHFHHPLLHKSNAFKIGVAAVAAGEGLLPVMAANIY